jgi:hypothetical protein
VLVPSPLGIKGVPSKKFQSNIRRCTLGKIFGVTIGRAAWEACSATWNLSTNSAFAPGPRETTENLDQVGRSQDLPDAVLASSLALNTRAPTLVPICVFFFFFLFFENICKLFLQKFYLYIIWISNKPCITPVEGLNALFLFNQSTSNVGTLPFITPHTLISTSHSPYNTILLLSPLAVHSIPSLLIGVLYLTQTLLVGSSFLTANCCIDIQYKLEYQPQAVKLTLLWKE